MGDLKLRVFDSIPEGFLNCEVSQLHDLYGGPFIIHIKKENTDSHVFVSTLLHGNEHSGLLAIQELLKSDYQSKHSLIIFVGNTIAAKENLRHLEGQPDYNRVWGECDTHESKLADSVVDYVKNYKLFCSIDIHNNTGKNPFYSCVNKLDEEFLYLAKLYSNHIVYFTEPHEVQSMTFSNICPSITIEAGQSREVEGIKTLVDKLSETLVLDTLSKEINTSELNIYHTVGRIVFNEGASISFGDQRSSADFNFLENIDELNFNGVSKDTILGTAKNFSYIRVLDNNNEDISQRFLKIEDGLLVVREGFVPAMFTKNITIIFDDCFGYIMEYYKI